VYTLDEYDDASTGSTVIPETVLPAPLPFVFAAPLFVPGAFTFGELALGEEEFLVLLKTGYITTGIGSNEPFTNFYTSIGS
jgi:hypothetical protein